MNTNIGEWLEANTGATRRQMAIKLGQAPSTFYRNVETAEVIIAVCRAYGINPIEGLVAAEILESDEVSSAASSASLSEVSESELLQEVLRRVQQRESSELAEPIDLNARQDPDYSNMTDDEAAEIGLAAKREDDEIGDSDVPNIP